MPTHAKSSAGEGQVSASEEDTLSRDVQQALRCSSHVGLRAVRCTSAGGHVTLTGDVASYYLKQIAQTIVGRVKNVESVNNQLVVVTRDAGRPRR
jgi:osmotically-inducible protein OsmY